MSARWLAVSMALLAAAVAQPAFAEDAKARGSSGGGSSSAGERHHSSSSGSSVSSSSSSSYSSSGSGSPGLTDAQRRHPRAGTGTGWRSPYYGRGGYGYRGYGGYGYGYGYRYRPSYWGYGYYPWGGLYLDGYWGSSPYYYGGYYGRGYYGGGYYGGYYVPSSRDTGSVRVLVDQHKAGVFVDGYYAGIVDDFDGIFQRLYVSPGHHRITVKLEGYQTHTFDVYVPYDGTMKLHWEMVRGSGDDGTGDPTLNAQERPGAREDRYDRSERRDQDRNFADRDDDDNATQERYAPSDENRWPRGRSAETGALHLNVRPDDASIYVDGAFRGTARELADLDLAAGAHRVEIVRPGYRTLEREVTVEGGRGVDLNVSLER